MSDSLSATTLEFDDTAEDARDKPAWAAVTSLTFGVFGLVTAEFLPASLLTPMAADVGVSVGAAGQAVTATAVVGAIAGLAAAIVTRGIDRRLVIWSLTGLLIVSSVIAAIATNLTTLLFARVLLGIGLGAFWSMVAATAMRLVPPSALPKAMSLIFAGVSLATVSAAPIGAYLGNVMGWRFVFWLSALVGVAALVIQMAVLPRLPARGSPDIRTLFRLLGQPSIALVLAGIVVVISGHFAGFTYVRPFLEQIPKLSVEVISLVLLAYGIGGFFGNFAGGAITARSAKASVIFGAFLIALVGISLLFVGASPLASAIAVGLWGFAFGALPVGFQTWLVRVAPEEEAESAGGLIVAAFQIAIASGAIFGGLLVDGFGTLGVIAYTTVATLVGGLGVLLLGSKSPERVGASAAAHAL
ncbi:DHA1 family purine ribonucleoside efflux pump-like MFS transporter [Bosea sp. AK1]|uniref:MFS transporter n=1 Tax=Bosea sp. AK1 TaxID=2587160 RepID=UPI001153638B|nr:MFS transporter [Bosea sp. AK1]TQI73094.1 DHA1 family purine ribonucleoside efflux pump-like MFS transporter [Bosea sp. AK1]